MHMGKVPGTLFVCSSRRYHGQFTDIIEKKAKDNPNVYIYDKKIWEVKPDAYSGEMFQVFMGDMSRNPRIIEDNEIVDIADRDLIIEVPVETRPRFENDVVKALQEVAGLSAQAVAPYLINRDAVSACFGKRQSVLSKSSIVSGDTVLLYPNNTNDPTQDRWMHLDLSSTKDCTGIACGYIRGFIEMEMGEHMYEWQPEIVIDFTLQIKPPKGGEIDYSRIRELLYNMRHKGLPIRWVSADQYQSRDTLQELRRQGFSACHRSVDKTIQPYDTLKRTLYDGRLEIPEDEVLLGELTALEIDHKKGKVDHPIGGGKDIADALAAVVFSLSNNTELKATHGVLQKEVVSQTTSYVTPIYSEPELVFASKEQDPLVGDWSLDGARDAW